MKHADCPNPNCVGGIIAVSPEQPVVSDDSWTEVRRQLDRGDGLWMTLRVNQCGYCAEHVTSCERCFNRHTVNVESLFPTFDRYGYQVVLGHCEHQ